MTLLGGIAREDGASPLMGREVGRIRIVEVLGEGGMGTVFVGHDEILHRKVAIKAIQSEHRLDPVARARFLREARILSQLDHANICTVHDFIADDEHDFLVMELIEGKNLAQALKDGLDKKAKMVVAEQLIAVLMAVHFRGLIHRDLKPANIMLLPSGDIKVLDFGLARSADEAPGEESTARVGARSLVSEQPQGLVSEPSGAVTVKGAIVGTIGYMSPEQASGEPATAASDICSVGLILQELFTEKPPFDSRLTARELLIRAASGGTHKVEGLPRQLTNLINRMKSVDPDARPSAQSAAQIFRRIRNTPRRRLRFFGVVALVVCALAALLKYNVDLRRERRIAVEERNRADGLISFMLDDIYGGLESIGRLDLLEKVADRSLEHFATIGEGDTEVAVLSMQQRALHNAGKVRFELDLPEANTAFERSLRVAERLVELEPANNSWRLAMAMDRYRLGSSFERQGALVRAREQLDPAVLIIESLIADEPLNPEYQGALAGVLVGRANVLAYLLWPSDKEAEQDYRRAIEIFERVITRQSNRQSLLGLAMAQIAYGGFLQVRDRRPEAVFTYQRSIELLQQMVARDSANIRLQRGLAVALMGLGAVLKEEGDLSGALAAFGRSRTIAEGVAARDPSNPTYEHYIGTNSLKIAMALHASGALAEALAEFQKAAEIFERLVELDPTNLGRHGLLVSARRGEAQVLIDQGAKAEAIERLEAAVVLLEEMEPYATTCEQANDVAWRYVTVGLQLQELGSPVFANAALQSAVDFIKPHVNQSAGSKILDTYVMPLLYLDRVEEARPVVESLLEQGWDQPTFLAECQRLGLIDP